MVSKIFISLLLSLLGLVFANHSVAQNGNNTIHIPDIMGTSWQMLSFQPMNDTDSIATVEDPSVYTLNFWPGGITTMRLNCNYSQGNWSHAPSANTSDGRLSFEKITATQALCPHPRLGELFSSQAGYINGYLLRSDRLFFTLKDDGGIFEFKYTGSLLVAPEDGGPRNWEVNAVTSLYNEPAYSAGVLTEYRDGTVLDNLGCEINESFQWWCDVQKLGGGLRGFVPLDVLKPATSPGGAIMTGMDDSAIRAGLGEFNASGTLNCQTKTGTLSYEESCSFGVARSGGGYSTVVITKPDGKERTIYFRMGIPIGVSSSEANGSSELNVNKKGDTHIIKIGIEEYAIPDAVVFGG